MLTLWHWLPVHENFTRSWWRGRSRIIRAFFLASAAGGSLIAALTWEFTRRGPWSNFLVLLSNNVNRPWHPNVFHIDTWRGASPLP